MRLLQWAKDGGPSSTVDGFFAVEIKSLFSIVLLRFGHGTRDAYHSHAFNALTWVLKGRLVEHLADGMIRVFYPSTTPKWTQRECIHKVESDGVSYAISFRGPWNRTWYELRGADRQRVKLGHGRVELHLS